MVSSTFFDPAEAATQRCAWDTGLRREILDKLHRMMIEHPVANPYAAGYRHMHEQLRHQEEHGETPDVVLRFRSGSTPDPRRYNEPSARDTAVVFSGSHPPTKRDITIYPRRDAGCGDTQSVSILNEHLDPLTYPLLFPFGVPGFDHRWARCCPGRCPT